MIGLRFTAAAGAAGIERRVTAHSGRVGLASELTTRGASTTDVMLAGKPGKPRGWSRTTPPVRPPNAGPWPAILATFTLAAIKAGAGERPLPSPPAVEHGGLTADGHMVVDVGAGGARRLRGTLPAGQPPAARRGPVADLWRGSDPRGGSIGRGWRIPPLVEGVPASAVKVFATETLKLRT